MLSLPQTPHADDPLGLDHLDQVVDEARLVLEHPDAVEGATQVPVGGVEDPHRTNLGTSADTASPPRRHLPSRRAPTPDQAYRTVRRSLVKP